MEIDGGGAGAEVVVDEAEPSNSKGQLNRPHLGDSAIKAPNTLICQQGSGKGAQCISDSGALHIFVMNQQPVRGRMFSPPRQIINEVLTSSK